MGYFLRERDTRKSRIAGRTSDLMEKKRTRVGGQHVAIVGGGIAGNSAASAAREFGSNVDITLFFEEDIVLYSPCAFYKYFTEEINEKRLFLKKPKDYADERIEIVLGQRIEEVDVLTKNILINDQRIHFDKLIIATGSKALAPPIRGIEKEGVFALKTMKDARSIINYPAGKIAVLGSGPIGIEVAIALRKKGLDVTVIEIMDQILPRHFDEVPSLILRQVLEEHGIKILTGERATEIIGNGVVKGLVTDKREIDCGMVVLGVGVRPNIELGQQMGVGIGPLGGIKTDDRMMTNIENVYACGDCVESKDIVTGENTLSLLWPNAKRQGWISGCNCVGKSERYIGSFSITIVEVFGARALSVGRSGASLSKGNDYRVIEGKRGSSYHRLILVEGVLIGMQLIDRSEHAGLLFSKMLRRENLTNLSKAVKGDKELSIRPWNYWVSQYV